MSFTLRSLQSDDLDAVLALAAACPEAPRWQRSDYQLFTGPAPENTPLRRLALVAVSGPEVLGFAVATLLLASPEDAPEENRCELESIVVRPDLRRQGIGNALLCAVQAWAVESDARLLTLEVRASNAPAIRLYQRFGFVHQARRPRYYADPEEDALLMKMDITHPSPGTSFFHHQTG